MPLYEYHCEACGADFEALVSFSKADSVSCELCGSEKVQRVNSTFAAARSDSGSSGFQGCLPSCSPGG
ncbi:zinc ribbon domain-containing protein [bacterium]|nr:zinc ribbon domain-containing protein [bacterium]